MNGDAKVLRFPISPMTFILHAVDRCPAFAAIAARLPEDGDPLRAGAERAMAEIFRRVAAAPPAVSRGDAEIVLDHRSSRDDVIVEAIDGLPTSRERGDLASFWKEVWHREADPSARDLALYYIALVGRLYAYADAEPCFHKAR